MPNMESLVPAAPNPSKIKVPTASPPLRAQVLHQAQFQRNGFPETPSSDSALAKVAKVDNEDKMDDDEEEGCFSSGLSSFFGAKAWVS